MRRNGVFYLSVAFLAGFAILVLRLLQLTVVQADTLQEQAEAQRLRSFDYYQYARGDILDRFGRELTGVEQACLVILPAMAGETTEDTATALAGILDASAADLAARLAEGNARSLAPYILKTGLRAEQAAAIRQAQLPGVMAMNLAARYDASHLASHLLGYVQPVGTDGTYQGVSGLEQQYDQLLRGRVDSQVVAQVDAAGMLSVDALYLTEAETKERHDLHLTIDRDYQQIAEDAFRELGYAGACAMMNPNNGDILALVSAPDFDPYGWQEPAADDVYLNKAILLYPPASTFKTVLALAALDSDCPLPDALDSEASQAREQALADGVAIDELAAAGEQADGEAITADTEAEEIEAEDAETTEPFFCSGSYTLENGHHVTCSAAQGHGEVDLSLALALSCNCYFVALGQRLGGETIRSYAEDFGLTELTVSGYEMPAYQETDFLDFSAAVPGDVANVSLGESGVQLSVIQEAVLTALCVNGGFRVTPRLVTHATDERENILFEIAIEAPQRMVDTATAEALRLMLVGTVEEGTANGAAGGYLTAGGKTGSSEQGTVWFSGFAPAETPEWVISVCVQDGSAGGVEAVAVFRYILDHISLLDGRI